MRTGTRAGEQVRAGREEKRDFKKVDRNGGGVCGGGGRREEDGRSLLWAGARASAVWCGLEIRTNNIHRQEKGKDDGRHWPSENHVIHNKKGRTGK
jgi:hypothetical protein